MMMLVHERIRRALASFNHLSPAERAEVEAHTRVCADCAQRLRVYRAMDEALAALPTPSASPALRARFLARLHALEAAEPASSPRGAGLIGARGLALAALAAALVLFWMALRWMDPGAPSGPGMTVGSSQPLTPMPITTIGPETKDGLQQVLFHFNMAQCFYTPRDWNQDGLLEIKVDRVWLSVRDWDTAPRWRVEGRYHAAAGDFSLFIAPRVRSFVSFMEADTVLKEGESDFVVEGHMDEGSMDMPAVFDLDISDRASHVVPMTASCVIQLGPAHAPTPTPRPNAVPRSTGWQRDYWKQERERALHYAPAIATWIAQRTWFTLPANIPWEYHKPLRSAVGTTRMGEVQLVYLAPPVASDSDNAQHFLNLYWRQGMPEDWEHITEFPREFVRASIDYTLPIQERMEPGDLPGSYTWQGTREIDGWTGKLWRRKLLGRPDEFWLLWHDANANLTYTLILAARDQDVFYALLRGLHAESPAQVSATRQMVMSWMDVSLAWGPPWLAQDMHDVSFSFDPSQCHNPDGPSAPPVTLTLTRLAANHAEDGVLRWLLEGTYQLRSDSYMNVLVALYPVEDGMSTPFRTSVMRTGAGLLPEYRRFAMLTEMQPPADGSLPQRLILTIQTAPDRPGWQCPITVEGFR